MVALGDLAQFLVAARADHPPFDGDLLEPVLRRPDLDVAEHQQVVLADLVSHRQIGGQELGGQGARQADRGIPRRRIQRQDHQARPREPRYAGHLDWQVLH